MLQPPPRSTLFPYTTLSDLVTPEGAPTTCRHAVSGTISLPFRGAFHLSLTVLVHYRSPGKGEKHPRSEEHTSELQSHSDLVCRLLLEKKNKMLLTDISVVVI